MVLSTLRGESLQCHALSFRTPWTLRRLLTPPGQDAGSTKAVCLVVTTGVEWERPREELVDHTGTHLPSVAKRQEECKFKANLGYIVRSHSKTERVPRQLLERHKKISSLKKTKQNKK